MSLKHKENITLFGLISTIILSGALLTLPSASADDVVDTITINVPTSCSMSSTIATGDEHTAEINNGQYNSAIGETTIKAFCNDNEGFSIYAIGYTDNQLGKNVLTNSTLGSTYDIVTGTAISGNTSNWAMKLSTITSPTPNYPIIIAGSTSDTLKQQNDPDFSNFTNVPDDYKKVAYRTSATDINPEGSSTAEGSTLKTTYQAYISPTQASGEYTGQVKYTMLHPYTEPAPFVAREIPTASGKICYYPNTNEHEGAMGCQDFVKERDWSSCYETDYESHCYDSEWYEIDIEDLPELDTYSGLYTLLASNYSRTGYGFAGWSDKFDYATNANARFYGPNETIVITPSDYQSPNNGLSLYAVWVRSQGNLQDTDKVAELCGTGTNALTAAPTNGTANLSSVSALTDQRDHQTYAIAKLADGKCWMIENLRLESTAEHNTDGTLAQGYHSSFAGLATAESANFTESTTANGLYTTGNEQGKITISGSATGFRFPRYNNTNTSARASNPAPVSNSGSMYSYGNYYTWHAAIADTTHYSSGNHGATSVCPTGWRLPIGDQSTADRSFGALSVALGGPAGGADADSSSTPTGAVMSGVFRSYPNNFLYSGDFKASLVYDRGSYGTYWSSAVYGNYNSYFMCLGSTDVFPGNDYGNKESGISIRCVSGS